MAAIHAREDGQGAVKCAHQYQNEIESATPAPNPNQLKPEPFFKGLFRQELLLLNCKSTYGR